MSREVKLIVFGLILVFAFYNKYNSQEELTDSSPVKSSTNVKGSNSSGNNSIPKNTPNKSDDWEQYRVYDTYTPVNGYSPYDSYFGKGVYNNSADNTINVKTPLNSDIVFLLVDVNSKKIIRNEFIRAGSTFDLTGIPYGTYSFKYFSGNNWSDDYLVNNGQYKGGFTKNGSFSKSDKWSDNMTFERGYYGSYALTLTEVVGGNLETESTTEDDFFN